MTNPIPAEDFPGYHKQSFALPYHGGAIWFEHLDALNANEALVLQKLASDVRSFSRPSLPSFLCFVFDDTAMTDCILAAVQSSILDNSKRFRRVAFCGLDRSNERKLQRALTQKGFAVGFFHGLEDAKEWLLPE